MKPGHQLTVRRWMFVAILTVCIGVVASSAGERDPVAQRPLQSFIDFAPGDIRFDVDPEDPTLVALTPMVHVVVGGQRPEPFQVPLTFRFDFADGDRIDEDQHTVNTMGNLFVCEERCLPGRVECKPRADRKCTPAILESMGVRTELDNGLCTIWPRIIISEHGTVQEATCGCKWWADGWPVKKASFGVPPGSRVRLTVDFRNEVPELNEQNNTLVVIVPALSAR